MKNNYTIPSIDYDVRELTLRIRFREQQYKHHDVTQRRNDTRQNLGSVDLRE